MAQIAYILLCHRNPADIIRQARQLTRRGDAVAIHFDRRAPKTDYAKLRAALKDIPEVVFARRRIACGWGEWSLVAATLEALTAAEAAFPGATHFYMLSGDCMPIKPADFIHDYLDREDVDYIESVDFHKSGWIRTGLTTERLTYRHLFNERAHPRLFYGALDAQKRLGLARRIPEDLEIMIGSQWWCLRRRTVEAVLEFIRRRRDVVRFFRTTWIPDETFFQTLVRHLVPGEDIRSRTLTFLLFSDYGMPVTFYNDHYDLLVAEEHLFARKISPEARDLKDRLSRLYVAEGLDIETRGEGAKLYDFLTTRGREGRRFAPRFWEKEATIGRERELLIVACKKWHVAKRLLAGLGAQSNLPAVEYIFDEEGSDLPDLGGIQETLAKRARHRRALVRMLFEFYDTDRLVLCMDPGNIDLVRDFYADRSTTRLLEIDCTFSDSYLRGHARRVGLAGPDTPDAALDAILPTIRNDVMFEMDRLRDEDLPGYHRIRERAEPPENAAPLSEFFSLPPERALALAETPYLFAD